MPHIASDPTEARRLTDVLRNACDAGERHTDGHTQVAERTSMLQMVLEGGVLRQRFLANGRRQTIAVYYRDDIINLKGYVGTGNQAADYLVGLQGTVVGYVGDGAVENMRKMALSGNDGIAVLLYRELGIAQERITCMGQRSAIEQMAHFLCETLVRCVAPLGDYRNDRCSLNMTQEMLSSVLGLSTVHVNRVLRDLRHLKLVDLAHRELIIHDFDGLAKLGEFDGAYLAPI